MSTFAIIAAPLWGPTAVREVRAEVTGAISWSRCTETQSNPETTLTGCSNIIEAERRPDGELAIAYNNRGLIYADRGEILRAIADYDASIRLSASDGVVYYNRGLARASIGDFAGAVADFDAAVNNRASVWPIHILVERGAARSRLGDFVGAIIDYSEAIAHPMNPLIASDVSGAFAAETRPEVFALRGEAYLQSGDSSGAIADFDRAIALNGTDVSALLGRAEAELLRGDDRAALAGFEASLELEPGNEHALERRRQLRARLGL